ncbi:hypothetical protein D9619_007425 [Psilocybe cf. subviscida]|uniref:Carboxylic ester hydrolase n=1 Tax=Psilocybe cf. subviscida TaxID=2480587 RepID=A0A8H5B338_9AGAR|nr:hypothetical protein D9619_007425 [Psilocybe cf. subviscida]
MIFTRLVLLAGLASRALSGTTGTKRAAGKSSLIGPSVTLDYGTFNGVEDDSTKIISFRGVRFADAPVGNLRWRAPVSPPSKHLGTVNASQFGDICIQAGQTKVDAGSSEDCLFGNVFIPSATKADSKLPVLVWFHGGGFQVGDTHGSPPELILGSSAEPLIFVSFEYRLGQFGFLGGAEIGADGAHNAGLLDQRAALRWVQRYIHLFGGDTSKVTIWGESAGAGSTMFHLIANNGNNEGLFRAAMGDSPSLSFTPPSDGTYIQAVFDQFAGFAGCKTASDLGCLRSASSATLTLAGSKLLNARPDTLFVFAPNFDSTFITTRPVEAFKAGLFAHVPILFGSNTNEGAHWSAELSDPAANTSMPNATEVTVFNFMHGQWDTLEQDKVDSSLALYPLATFNGSFSLQGQQMYGESRYICTAVMMTAAVSAVQGEKAFQFHYDNPHLSSDHGAELDAFFNPPSNSDANDLALFEAMREYWTSFVTTGSPSAKNAAQWKPVSDSATGSPRILLHPAGIAMEQVSETLSSHCDFWHGLADEMQV